MSSHTDHTPSPTTPAGWHVDGDLLDRYAAGTLDAATEWSVEAHVTACATCRGAVSPVLTTAPVAPLVGDRLQAIWADIEHELDQPRLTPTERAMQRLGVPEHIARLLAATPSLTLAWIGAIAVVVGVAVLAAWSSRGTIPAPYIGSLGGSNDGLLIYLVTAPLLPLAGIAVAYGKQVDPTYEIGLSAPSRSGRVLLIRATAVLVVSLVLSGVGTLFLPSLGWAAVSWVLPALGLAALTLALSSFVAPLYAAIGTAVGWVSIVGYVELSSRQPLAAFQAPTQVIAVVTIAAAALWLHNARDRFELDNG